jgi:hypothetical protein
MRVAVAGIVVVLIESSFRSHYRQLAVGSVMMKKVGTECKKWRTTRAKAMMEDGNRSVVSLTKREK